METGRARLGRSCAACILLRERGFPGPSCLDPGSGGPKNDFTSRNATFMSWNLIHMVRMLKDAGGFPHMATGAPNGTRGAASTSTTPLMARRKRGRSHAP